MIVVSVSAAASSPARPASAQPRMRLFAHPLRLDNAGAIATAAVDLCEPDLTVTGAQISQANGRQNVSVTVAWDLSGEDI